MNKKIIGVAVCSLATLCLHAEISAFGAGDLNVQNPYGLTDNEKQLLRNKRDVATLESSFNSVQEQMQGIQSLLEGLSSKISRLEQRVNDLEFKINGDTNSSNESISSLRSYIDETRNLQEKNYANIQNTLKQLGKLIDKKASDTSMKSNSKSDLKNSKDLSKINNKQLLDDAIKLFNSNKLSDSKEYFEYLVKKNYRLATSNFYLGEIAYKDKSYASAIKYYQKSIEADDKASYLPRLLYHTAISFDKIGDTSSANRFYKALKVGYPDSKEARISPERK